MSKIDLFPFTCPLSKFHLLEDFFSVYFTILVEIFCILEPNFSDGGVQSQAFVINYFYNEKKKNKQKSTTVSFINALRHNVKYTHSQP